MLLSEDRANPMVPVEKYGAGQVDYVDNNENNDPPATPDDVFLNGIQSLNIQQKYLLRKVSNAIEKDTAQDKKFKSIVFIHHSTSW